ncbi:hypothetical protein FGW37_05435 [Streptomyces rectiverticillatus]|uniref:hypothetical protein n=1 Tax=Streptomyces rectiverticillatus TaxID=173860 RepID=UPI0015C36FEC|nr:hypothetical protein [Streptomyces rectiverticillatus]QLE71119.1 hypothetical protein FGW37_05435 [Streptomyces rectiverticillatus]
MADASAMNTRMRDTHRQLANPVRLAVAGATAVTSVPDNGTFKTLKWDSADWVGNWTSIGGESYAVPVSGTYFITADVTALSPADISRRPALRLIAISQTNEGEKELMRSYNSVIVPSTYLTCSLRGVVHLDKDSRISVRVGAVPTTGPWEVSAGSRTSAQLNRFTAFLIDARKR